MSEHVFNEKLVKLLHVVDIKPVFFISCSYAAADKHKWNDEIWMK